MGWDADAIVALAGILGLGQILTILVNWLVNRDTKRTAESTSSDVAEIKQQVKNSHTTNLREDMDSLAQKVGELKTVVDSNHSYIGELKTVVDSNHSDILSRLDSINIDAKVERDLRSVEDRRVRERLDEHIKGAHEARLGILERLESLDPGQIDY